VDGTGSELFQWPTSCLSLGVTSVFFRPVSIPASLSKVTKSQSTGAFRVSALRREQSEITGKRVFKGKEKHVM
jgi:hypothetical protein